MNVTPNIEMNVVMIFWVVLTTYDLGHRTFCRDEVVGNPQGCCYMQSTALSLIHI